MSYICRAFRVREDVEVTLEANPGTVSVDSLRELREAGINRLSIGAQSFRSKSLKLLGRMHTADHTHAAVEAARECGFRNISLDLIYGAPEQTVDDLLFDLEELYTLQPSHVSLYGLTIEKGTPFYQQYMSGKLRLPQENTLITMMKKATAFLEDRGYARYEISNYAREGMEARHNLVYWNGGDYLGLGAGAHSFCRGGTSSSEDTEQFPRRWSNYALPNRYMEEASGHGNASSWSEVLDRKGEMFEFFFLGLRKLQGVRFSEFLERFGEPVEAVYPALLNVLVEHKLLERDDDFLRLSAKGLMVADSVIENFADPEMSVASSEFEAVKVGNG